MPRRFPHNRRDDTPHPTWSFSRWYGVISLLGATFAIVSAPGVEEGIKGMNNNVDPPTAVLHETTISESFFSPKILRNQTKHKKKAATNHNSGGGWGLTKFLVSVATAAAEPPPQVKTSASSWIDPSILQFTAQTPTDLMDKVISSSARLLLIANWLLACTVILHTFIAEFFLGVDVSSNASSSNETRCMYLIFKLLLISSVVAQDHLDWLILLSWYTVLQFLRSLVSLCAHEIANARGSGQVPIPGVWKLLSSIFVLNGLACASCIGLLHEAGVYLLLVLTCDCILLAMDVLAFLMQCQTVVNEFRHQEHMAVLEHEQLLGYDRDIDIERLERRRLHHSACLDAGIFYMQFLFDIVTILHYVHIWTLHKLQFTLIDAVLAIQLYSAVHSVNSKIAEKRKLHQIAKDMDAEFQDASELEIKKAAACGDVCCICLSSMSWIGLRNTHVKKLKCGHMYHTSCLREVVERARSMDAARCPMCRTTIHAAPPPHEPEDEPLPQVPHAPPQPQQAAPAADEPPLFRFTTAGLIPWLPAISFEVVRRPDNDTVTVWRRFFGMTEAEEQAALQQLVDMFPQYERNNLMAALRERGSGQAVAEAILLGTLTPAAAR